MVLHIFKALLSILVKSYIADAISFINISENNQTDHCLFRPSIRKRNVALIKCNIKEKL